MLEWILKSLSSLWKPRRLLLVIALYCAGLMLFALGLVYFVGIAPCPLCIVQRFFYIAIGFTALVGTFGWMRAFTVARTGMVVAVLACTGWLFAARHVSLQRFAVSADPSSGCAVSFGSFLDDLIAAVGGTGSCARIDWTLLGLSIADWSLLAFTLLAGLGLSIYLRARTLTSGATPLGSAVADTSGQSVGS